MKQRLVQGWQALTIRKKITGFSGGVLLIVLLSLVFDIWVVKFSLVDFYKLLEDNAQSSELITDLEEESSLFETYIKKSDEENRRLLQEAMEKTYDTVYSLPLEYREIGEVRYAKTWSILNSYEIYCIKRDALLSMDGEGEDYISKLYEIYDIQSYLQDYARILMTDTLEAGSITYQKKIPGLIVVPVIVILFGIALFWGMVELAGILNKTIIDPIMELAQASKRIADNDFFIDDVQVENKDEMGELVSAFNKMKYATGEYILALEEKRKTLDLLHKEELERLEVEKRLETINLELLKSQIDPHFLFNTLNVIGGMANLEEAETTEKMIKALSSIFRYNLKTPDAEASLSQELKIVRDYMYLQQMRFGSRFSYTIDCELDTDNYMVPTFSFQPLVENGIIHGLSRKEEGGNIAIKIWEEQNNLMIAISDTGVGISAEKLEAIKKAFKENDNRQMGIGLGNIYKRVHGMYKDGEVEIFSEEEKGTTILLIIPQKN